MRVAPSIPCILRLLIVLRGPGVDARWAGPRGWKALLSHGHMHCHTVWSDRDWACPLFCLPGAYAHLDCFFPTMLDLHNNMW
jgi:hypothetical protein